MHFQSFSIPQTFGGNAAIIYKQMLFYTTLQVIELIYIIIGRRRLTKTEEYAS